jgi:hypothetical protein
VISSKQNIQEVVVMKVKISGFAFKTFDGSFHHLARCLKGRESIAKG